MPLLVASESSRAYVAMFYGRQSTVPEMRIWSTLLIGSDFKWRMHLSRSLFLCIDLSKTFDTVNHEVLLHKILSFGICQNFLKWFQSYLSYVLVFLKGIFFRRDSDLISWFNEDWLNLLLVIFDGTDESTMAVLVVLTSCYISSKY